MLSVSMLRVTVTVLLQLKQWQIEDFTNKLFQLRLCNLNWPLARIKYFEQGTFFSKSLESGSHFHSVLSTFQAY